MRLLLTILTLTTFLFGATQMGLKGGSCTLSQKGAVTLNYHSTIYKDVTYSASHRSGKNFREIFVGSSMSVGQNISLKILDYKPNKRFKGKPKTGIFMVIATINKKIEHIQMAYIFDKGMISATGVLNKTTIGFSTEVDYSFCTLGKK